MKNLNIFSLSSHTAASLKTVYVLLTTESVPFGLIIHNIDSIIIIITCKDQMGWF